MTAKEKLAKINKKGKVVTGLYGVDLSTGDAEAEREIFKGCPIISIEDE